MKAKSIVGMKTKACKHHETPNINVEIAKWVSASYALLRPPTNLTLDILHQHLDSIAAELKK